MFRHTVDGCSQNRIEGWSTAPWVEVAVNDGVVGRILPDLPRPDLVEAGIGPGAGFRFHLPQPLWLDDVISLHGPDGSVTQVGLGERAAARLQELTCCFDPAARSGLEIGALDCPLIPRGRFSIWRADQAPREELAARYGHGIEPSMIADPDFITGTLPLAAAVGGRRFGYAVASHVMEHVPDMIG